MAIFMVLNTHPQIALEGICTDLYVHQHHVNSLDLPAAGITLFYKFLLIR